MTRHRVALSASLSLVVASLAVPSHLALAGLEPRPLESLLVPTLRLESGTCDLDDTKAGARAAFHMESRRLADVAGVISAVSSLDIRLDESVDPLQTVSLVTDEVEIRQALETLADAHGLEVGVVDAHAVVIRARHEDGERIGDVQARLGVRVGPTGEVEDVTSVDVLTELSEWQRERVADVARTAAAGARFAPGAVATETVLDLTWEAGSSGRFGSGPAVIEETPSGRRAVVPAPMRLSTDMVPPEIVHRVDPVVPAATRAAQQPALVVVEAVVGADGIISGVKVLKSEDPLLARAAVEAVRQWLYRPATLDGVPVAVMLVVRVQFRLG